jgi:hypothetical protein
MPKYLSKAQEKTWRKAKKAFKSQSGRKPGKKDWPLVMHIFKNMNKTAANIVIEPYEKYVQDGIELAEKVMGSGYFSGIKKIVVQTGQTHHYGQVLSDDPGTIYISADRIEREFASIPLERAFQMASTLCHETAHIKSKFQGGENPALAEEQKFAHLFGEKIKANPKDFEKFTKAASRSADIVRMAHMADASGHYAAAAFLDTALMKSAADQIDAEQIINGVGALIGYMVSRVSPEKRVSFKQSIIRKISQVGTDLAQKRKNPSAGIGAVFGLLKNLLSGLDASQISYIMGQILSRYS